MSPIRLLLSLAAALHGGPAPSPRTPSAPVVVAASPTEETAARSEGSLRIAPGQATRAQRTFAPRTQVASGADAAAVCSSFRCPPASRGLMGERRLAELRDGTVSSSSNGVPPPSGA